MIKTTRPRFFISHASEDKDSFVREFADLLILSGANVFYDEYSLRLGDSLFDSINKGIKEAEAGIIVLSKDFIKKKWTNQELRAIYNKHLDNEVKLIPLYLNVSFDEVKNEYPLIADILGVDIKVGLSKVVEKVFYAVDSYPKPTHMETNFENGKNEIQNSWTIILSDFNTLFLGNDKDSKVILEIGVQNQLNNRIRLSIERGKRLTYSIICAEFNTISLSLDISSWKETERHWLIASYNKTTNLMRFSLDLSPEIKEITTSKLKLPDNFFSQGKMTLGCSIEREYPSAVRVGGLMIYNRMLSLDEIGMVIKEHDVPDKVLNLNHEK